MVQGKRAVIYCRVSTADQNCQRQLHDLEEFAKRAGYEIIDRFTETASGANNDRPERNKVMELAQARKIDVILVTELSRWGRNTLDLLGTLKKLSAWNISVVPERGHSLDFVTAEDELLTTIMAALAEFERNLIRERITSGLAAARAKGKKLGRQQGQNPSDKYKDKVLAHLDEHRTYRWIAHEMQISKSTVTAIAKRHRNSTLQLAA